MGKTGVVDRQGELGNAIEETMLLVQFDPGSGTVDVCELYDDHVTPPPVIGRVFGLRVCALSTLDVACTLRIDD